MLASQSRLETLEVVQDKSCVRACGGRDGAVFSQERVGVQGGVCGCVGEVGREEGEGGGGGDAGAAVVDVGGKCCCHFFFGW